MTKMSTLFRQSRIPQCSFEILARVNFCLVWGILLVQTKLFGLSQLISQGQVKPLIIERVSRFQFPYERAYSYNAHRFERVT